MHFLGVDPGLEGAIALWAEDGIEAVDLPTYGEGAKRRVDARALARIISAWQRPDHAFIERAGAMPRQGVASGFRYGRAVGTIEAVLALLGIPVMLIEPTAWKRTHGLIGRGKEDSRQRALQLLPQADAFLRLRKDHGKAEALLIAMHGARVLGYPIRGFQKSAERAIIPA